MRGFHFNYRFTDEQLRRDFERFIENNVQTLFSDKSLMTQNYTIPYTLARSVVNNGGAIRETLMEVANEIKVPSSNNSPYAPIHIAQTLATVHGIANGGFQKLINELRFLNKFIKDVDYKWNIVWYTRYRDIAMTFG